MELYAVTVCWNRYYFWGTLTDEAAAAADSFCTRAGVGAADETPQELFGRLLEYITSELKCPVQPVGIGRVFRIGR